MSYEYSPPDGVISRTFTVNLEWYEAEVARYIGRLRHQSAEKRGIRDRHHKPADGQSCHEGGALAEVAAAKALDLYWNGSVDTFSTGADVSDRVQVRWTAYPNGHLIVHDCDRDIDAFVLVTGKGTAYTLRGWAYGAEAKRIGDVMDNGDRWVRQADLHPMSTLRGALP